MNGFGGRCFGSGKGSIGHVRIKGGGISILISEDAIDVGAEMEGELVWQVKLNFIWPHQHIIRKTALGKLPIDAFVRVNGRVVDLDGTILDWTVLVAIHPKFVFECEGFSNNATKNMNYIEAKVS